MNNVQIRDAADGNLYGLEEVYGDNTYTVTLRQFSPQTNSFTTIFQNRRLGRYRSIEARNGLYYLSSSQEVAVFTNDGSLQARLTTKNARYPENVTVNSEGKIALIDNNNVVLLTPRYEN